MLTALSLALAAISADAKRLYKYQDEDGIWHFTDKKPDTEQPVEERLLEVDPDSPVSARKETVGRDTRYFFTNRRQGPIELEITLVDAENIRANPTLPNRFVIAEPGEHWLLTIGPKDRRRGYRFEIRYQAIPGDPSSRPDRQHAYQIPFQDSKRYYVSQGFNGTATHQDKQARHAIDITMPVGTPIQAARGGIVMHVEEDFFGSGQKERFGNRANHVRILHDDGSMGLYAHLKTESVKVRAGQVVVAGEVIALSGNTGYSSGPHLHFAVQRNAGMSLETVPFRFSDGQGGQFEPQAQTWLRHTASGYVTVDHRR